MLKIEKPLAYSETKGIRKMQLTYFPTTGNFKDFRNYIVWAII